MVKVDPGWGTARGGRRQAKAHDDHGNEEHGAIVAIRRQRREGLDDVWGWAFAMPDG